MCKIQAKARISEGSTSAVVRVQAGALVTEAYMQAVVYRSPCASQRADFWTIERTDGVILAFTSHDEDVTLGNLTYKHCGSLQDSAADSDSDVTSVGSIDLVGLITDDSITEDDLYAGLYDDAYVECWERPLNGIPDPGAPFMVASGWIGKLTRKQNSWEGEVQGAGAKMAQTALVQFYAPACRWQFGSPSTSTQPGCGVNAESYRVWGTEVTSIVGRGIIYFAPEAVPAEALWNNGLLTFTSGRNAGLTCQIETMDWASGALSLWDLAPFPPAPGDDFSVIPGCSYDKPGCVVYNNLINFGGYPDVPGPDALQQNADAIFAANSGG